MTDEQESERKIGQSDLKLGHALRATEGGLNKLSTGVDSSAQKLESLADETLPRVVEQSRREQDKPRVKPLTSSVTTVVSHSSAPISSKADVAKPLPPPGAKNSDVPGAVKGSQNTTEEGGGKKPDWGWDALTEAGKVIVTLGGVGAALFSFKAALLMREKIGSTVSREYADAIAKGSPGKLPETRAGRVKAAVVGSLKKGPRVPVLDTVLKLGKTLATADTPVEKAEGYGGAIGGMVGTVVGGALGSFLGPAGTAVGASIGSFGGELLGQWIGNKLVSENKPEDPAKAVNKQAEGQAGKGDKPPSTAQASPSPEATVSMLALAAPAPAQSVQVSRDLQFNPTINFLGSVQDVATIRQTVEAAVRQQVAALQQYTRTGQLYDDPNAFV